MTALKYVALLEDFYSDAERKNWSPFDSAERVSLRIFADWLDARPAVETSALLEDELTVWECGYCKAFNVERRARNCIYCLRDRPALKTEPEHGA